MTMPLFGQLADSPAAIVAQMLIDLGYAQDPLGTGTADEWPISVDSELDSPDDVICLTNTEPVRNGRFQGTGEMNELFCFQTKVRASDGQLAWGKANDLAVTYDQRIYMVTTVLQPNSSTAGGTYRVGRVTRKSGPMALGREGSATKRHLYTINAIVDIIQLS